MAIADHRDSFLDGELCRLFLGRPVSLSSVSRLKNNGFAGATRRRRVGGGGGAISRCSVWSNALVEFLSGQSPEADELYFNEVDQDQW